MMMKNFPSERYYDAYLWLDTAEEGRYYDIDEEQEAILRDIARLSEIEFTFNNGKVKIKRWEKSNSKQPTA